MSSPATHSCRTFRSSAVLQPSCTQYRHLKLSLRRQLAAMFQETVPVAQIRRAVEEAERMALSTEFPHLFLPELAREYVTRISARLGTGTFLTEPRLSTASAA